MRDFLKALAMVALLIVLLLVFDVRLDDKPRITDFELDLIDRALEFLQHHLLAELAVKAFLLCYGVVLIIAYLFGGRGGGGGGTDTFC